MLETLLTLATRVTVEAAGRAARARREGVEVAGLKSTPTDVVTRADEQTEAYLIEEILSARPGDGILGEEGGGIASTSGLTWVIDPIDGTVNYLYDIPAWAVSVAVVEGDPRPATWRTLAGCVVNPVTREVYAAAAGSGATLNDRPLALAPKSDLGSALVATGFAYAADRRLEQAAIAARVIGRVRDLRRMGASSLDFCGVAAGRLDGYWETGLHPWDHAAGALIAREAGAVVSGLAEGSREGMEFALAANPGLAEALRSVLLSSGAREYFGS